MSKGLEALKRIKPYADSSIDGELDTIEKELKELEVRRKMMRKFDLFMKRYNIDSVEELDTFFNEHLNNDIDKCSKCRELKALETVKKAFDSSSIYTNKLKDSLECGWITQEEYDLLKKVLL